MSENPRKICPHAHLSMQSGSNTVLERMRRRLPVEQFAERCAAVVARLDRPALTTDIIVGFPGETDAEHEETCGWVQRLGFAKVHVFRFSPREGTPAVTMDGQVDNPVKRRRAEEMARCAARSRVAFARSLVGSTAEVLIESADGETKLSALQNSRSEDHQLRGTCERYLPVELTGPAASLGELVTVNIDRADKDVLRAKER